MENVGSKSDDPGRRGRKVSFSSIQIRVINPTFEIQNQKSEIQIRIQKSKPKIRTLQGPPAKESLLSGPKSKPKVWILDFGLVVLRFWGAQEKLWQFGNGGSMVQGSILGVTSTHQRAVGLVDLGADGS